MATAEADADDCLPLSPPWFLPLSRLNPSTRSGNKQHLFTHRLEWQRQVRTNQPRESRKTRFDC